MNATFTNSGVHQGALPTRHQLSQSLKLTENPGEAEVAQFDDLVFGDENIFGLDVSVNTLQAGKD